MELVEKMTCCPTDLACEQTLWGALGSGVVIPVP